MVELSPWVASGTLIAAFVIYLLTFAYSIYMAYVGWKQAKVTKQMDQVIILLEEIKNGINRTETERGQ